MFLIDSSVLIDYFRQIENEATATFTNILNRNLSYGITGIIYQEILQGARSVKDFNRLKEYFTTQKFFYSNNEKATHESAAKLYFLCRKKGITIRSTIDCYIAQIAIEHNLILLHNDQDYVRINTICPELNLFKNFLIN